jgi:nucleotide-binding universal stress UspA family protein
MANTLNEPIKKIIWAIDPFETGVTLDPSAFEEFSQWTRERDIIVEPTYVHAPLEATKIAQDHIEARIAEIVGQSKVKTTATPKLLLELSHSNASRIGSLISHATSGRAGLIAISSRCRSGLKRIVFGSFAESLLTVSPIPILFLNQNALPKESNFKKVLWATDFSQSCEFAFETFLKQAKGIFHEIVLFHDLSLSLEMSQYSGWDGFLVNMDEISESKRNWASREAASWANKIKKHGFNVRVIIESEHDVSADILSTAKEAHAGSIAMASETGPFASLLIGSHARKVFKASQFPVWIYGPGFCEMYKTPPKSAREEHVKHGENIDETPANGFSVMNFLGIVVSIAILLPLALGFFWILFFSVSGLLGAVGIFVPKVLQAYDERWETTHPDKPKSPGHRIKRAHRAWKSKRGGKRKETPV